MSDRQKRTLSFAMLSLILVAVLVVTVTFQQGHANQTGETHEPPLQLNLVTLLQRAHEVGLTPDVMVAGSVTREQVVPLCDVLRLWDEEFLKLETTSRDANTTRSLLNEVRRTMRERGGTPELQVLRAEYETELAAIESNVGTMRDAIKRGFMAHCTSVVGADNGSIMERCFANMHRKVPRHMRAMDLNEQEWRDLEIALVKQKIDVEFSDVTLSAAESAVLSRANADATAMLVLNRLNSGTRSDAINDGLVGMTAVSE